MLNKLVGKTFGADCAKATENCRSLLAQLTGPNGKVDTDLFIAELNWRSVTVYGHGLTEEQRVLLGRIVPVYETMGGYEPYIDMK
jgi:hypothetical protein